MTTQEGNNAVVARHLEALANAAKKYTLAELANISVSGESCTLPTASTTTKGGVKIGDGLQMDGDTLNVTLQSGSAGDGIGVLDTVPSTVDGGFWFDTINDMPVLTLRHGNYEYNFKYDTIIYKGGNSHLAAYLPFDASPTADACGNTWVVTGNPIITADPTGNGNALYLDGSSYLTLDNFQLGGKDFTLDAWFYFITIPSPCTRVLELYNNNVERHMPIQPNGYYYQSNFPCPQNTWNHCATVYTNDDGYFRCYINGQLVEQVQLSALQVRQQFPTMYIGTSRYGDRLNGYVNNFRIFDGQALWTQDFTPPTASDYLR